MDSMQRTANPTARERGRRRPLVLAGDARRRLDRRPRSRGRAWINGREVGGAADRFAHLGHSHD